MTVDIFIVSYYRDAHWLRYALRSIQKYAKGFRDIVVVYPTRDVGPLKLVCDEFPFVKQHTFDEKPDGHTHQNVIKTQADLYSDAEYILHIDSDCVFVSEARPEDYMTLGKPDIIYTPYAELEGVPWQGITTRALGLQVQVETMRRFPFLYPRFLYKATRDRIESVNHQPFENYCFNAPCILGAFRPYSEFNALGCTAFYLFRDYFYFYDSKHNLKEGHVLQQWSHSGLCENDQATAEKHTKGWNEKAYGA